MYFYVFMFGPYFIKHLHICRLLIPLCRRTLGLSPEVGSLVLLCRCMNFKPDLWLRVAPLYSVSFSSQYRNIEFIDCGWSENSFISFIGLWDTRTELGPDPPAQYLNSKSHGQNLTSTPGKAEPNAQYFYENSTTGLSQNSHWESELCTTSLYLTLGYI